MNAKPGEIWLADLGLAAKTRPVLIVSHFDPDAPRALITYVPLTTQHRGSRYEIPLGALPFFAPTVRRQRPRYRISGRTPVRTQAGTASRRRDGEGQRGHSLRARTVTS
jgi:hypothetical protein